MVRRPLLTLVAERRGDIFQRLVRGLGHLGDGLNAVPLPGPAVCPWCLRANRLELQYRSIPLAATHADFETWQILEFPDTNLGARAFHRTGRSQAFEEPLTIDREQEMSASG